MTQQLRPPTDDPPRDAPSLVLAGRYHVFDVIGRGGMASVHRGRDMRLDRLVAVKLLHDHLADDDRVRDRFRREALAAARLNHPGVVAVYDHWRGGDTDPPYIVMELVDGGSVRDVLDVRGALSPGQVLALLRPAAAGLADAHARGLVHRDVTPANILVTPDGASKVGDFGLARVAAASTSTFPEGVVGSPHYMSPEAVRGEPLDARADVYALGCVLYECLTGSTPFSGDSPQAVAVQHGVEPVPPPSRTVPVLSRRLDELVARATAPAPGDRFRDAGALVRALDEAVPEGPEPIDLRTASNRLRIDGSHATSMLDDDPLTIAIGREDAGRDRPRWVRPLVALLLAVVVTAGGWLTWDRVVAPVTPVPTVAGQPVTDARVALEEAGFRVTVADERRNDLTVPAGAVLSQAPTGEARRGTVVELVESDGPRTAELPLLAGRTEQEARDAVAALGIDLTVTRVDQHDDEAAPGVVLSSDPVVGVTVEETDEITLVVSVGPAPVDVPALRGEGQATATETLVDLGLDVEVVEQRHDDTIPQGAVLETRPAPGTTLRRGDTVGLVLSQGPAPVEVPDVTGMSEAEATSTLEALGLVVEVEYVPRILPIGIGTVDDHTPSAGQVRLRGTTVRLFVWTLG